MKRSWIKRGTSQMKRTPLRKVSPNKKSNRSRKMALKRSVLDQYGLPMIECNRYGEGKSAGRTDLLKGMLWTVFSRYIRRRDQGKCISCGACKAFEELQAGHFVPAGGNDLSLCFDEENVNGECSTCNADFDGWHLIPMKRNLLAKYGVEKVAGLEKRKESKLAVKWEEIDYVERIKKYLALLEDYKNL